MTKNYGGGGGWAGPARSQPRPAGVWFGFCRAGPCGRPAGRLDASGPAGGAGIAGKGRQGGRFDKGERSGIVGMRVRSAGVVGRGMKGERKMSNRTNWNEGVGMEGLLAITDADGDRWEDLGEGPWETEEQAAEYGHAEVGVEYRIAYLGKWFIFVRREC